MQDSKPSMDLANTNLQYVIVFTQVVLQYTFATLAKDTQIIWPEMNQTINIIQPFQGVVMNS